MTKLERMQFIDEELKGLWPQWTPTEAEVRTWMGVLAGADYPSARTALQQCFCEQAGNYARPKPGPLLAKLRLLAVQHHGAACPRPCDLWTSVFVECLTPPPGRPRLAGWRLGVYVHPRSRQTDPDYVRACAEAMRTRLEQVYAGRWIIVVEGVHGSTEPGEAGPDGREGSDSAYRA
jgi:hypothetical protein